MRTQLAVVIAEACYAVQVAYAKSIGDNSMPAWQNLDGSTKYSYVDNVQECVAHPTLNPEEVQIFYCDAARTKNALFQATAVSTYNAITNSPVNSIDLL